jgi:hypothetical protein
MSQSDLVPVLSECLQELRILRNLLAMHLAARGYRGNSQAVRSRLEEAAGMIKLKNLPDAARKWDSLTPEEQENIFREMLAEGEYPDVAI